MIDVQHNFLYALFHFLYALLQFTSNTRSTECISGLAEAFSTANCQQYDSWYHFRMWAGRKFKNCKMVLEENEHFPLQGKTNWNLWLILVK